MQTPTPSGILSAVRRARLARVLRFYADKARRHADDGRGTGLSAEKHREFLDAIDRMIANPQDYSFATPRQGDRGWIFCPECAGTSPLEVFSGNENTTIYLFGPAALPDGLRPVRTLGDPTLDRPSVHRPPQAKREEKPAENMEAPTSQEPAQAGQVDHLGVTEAPALQEPASPPLSPDTSGGHAPGTDAPSAHVPAYTTPEISFGTDLITGDEVYWRPTLRGNPHLLLVGLPGMGKTTCLLNLCTQMLGAQICPIIFSYHQDIDQRLSEAVTHVHFVDYEGLGFNPLAVRDRTSQRAYLDVAGALRDIFWAIFPDLGDVQGELIRNAIKQSFIEKGWGDPNAELAKLQEPEFRRFVEILRSQPRPNRGLRTILARLGELEDYGFFDLSETRQSLWEGTQPIVIRIHTSQNENLQKAFASLVFYGLYKDMFRRGIQERITHAIVFDEAHRAAKLKRIPTMAKECRKYGISLILASQEARDFHTSVFSAIANYLVLRLTEPDARALVRNVARSDQERVLVDQIKQMERFRALYFSETNTRPARVALRP